MGQYQAVHTQSEFQKETNGGLKVFGKKDKHFSQTDKNYKHI